MVVGDFNIDFNKHGADIIRRLSRDYNLRSDTPNLPINIPTHIRGNQLDWIFTNMADPERIVTTVYESWWSDHTPFFIEVRNNFLDNDDENRHNFSHYYDIQ